MTQPQNNRFTAASPTAQFEFKAAFLQLQRDQLQRTPGSREGLLKIS